MHTHTHTHSNVLFKFVERALWSQAGKADAEQRAEQFKLKYIQRLRELHENPWYVAHHYITGRINLTTKKAPS